MSGCDSAESPARTLAALLGEVAERWPTRPALEAAGRVWRYEELAAAVEDDAGLLAARGVAAGERFALALGRGRALRLALDDAGLAPREVGHIDAHGTATVANDPAEARALRALLGAHLDTVPVTAIKSAIGHLMAAAGAVAAVVAVGTLVDGLVPPIRNHDRTDPDCALDLVTARPRRVAPRVVLSEAFGFGGHNSAVALTAP